MITIDDLIDAYNLGILTKEEFKMYVKNISILMSNVKQS